MTPVIYWGNLFRRGTLSGTNTDEAFPVRRVGDDDLTLRYPIVSGTVSGLVSGEVSTTLASGVTPDAFVMARGQSLSGIVFEVISQDVGGANAASHGTFTASGDDPFVLELSGVSTARRQWRVTLSGTVSGATVPDLFEIILADKLTFPRDPQIGVSRTTAHQVSRIPIPGGAPFKLRLGTRLRQTSYSMVVEDPLVSGVKNFLNENDGGQNFWHVDDKGGSYFAEMLGPDFVFDDQAGVNFFALTVRELRAE